MTHIINRIDAATAQRIRDAIAGKPQLKAAKPKQPKPVKNLCSQFHKYDPARESHTIQLPIVFNTGEYNAEWIAWELRSKWVKEKREMAWLALSAYLPNMRAPSVSFSRVLPDELKYTAPSYMRFLPDDERAVRAFCSSARAMRERARVRRIEFVRIGTRRLDDDNLVAAFKSIRDAACSYLVHGTGASRRVLSIGKADDKLWKAGVRWTYRQQKCESNPRLYGIRIILHCEPPSSE